MCVSGKSKCFSSKPFWVNYYQTFELFAQNSNTKTKLWLRCRKLDKMAYPVSQNHANANYMKIALRDFFISVRLLQTKKTNLWVVVMALISSKIRTISRKPIANRHFAHWYLVSFVRMECKMYKISYLSYQRLPVVKRKIDFKCLCK